MLIVSVLVPETLFDVVCVCDVVCDDETELLVLIVCVAVDVPLTVSDWLAERLALTLKDKLYSFEKVLLIVCDAD